MPSNYKRGDLVYAEIDNQAEEGFSNKLSIVLDSNGTLLSLVPCTTQTQQTWRYKDTFIIKKNDFWGKIMNLKDDTLVILDRFDSYPDSVITRRHLGKAPNDLLEYIESLLS